MGIDVGRPIAAARLDDLDQIGVAEPVERPEGCGVELRRVADDAGIELHPALVERDPLVVPGERPERAAHEVHRVVIPVPGAGVGVARPEDVDRLVAADALPRRGRDGEQRAHVRSAFGVSDADSAAATDNEPPEQLDVEYGTDRRGRVGNQAGTAGTARLGRMGGCVFSPGNRQARERDAHGVATIRSNGPGAT